MIIDNNEKYKLVSIVWLAGHFVGFIVKRIAPLSSLENPPNRLRFLIEVSGCGYLLNLLCFIIALQSGIAFFV
jgi:hypothetical protein